MPAAERSRQAHPSHDPTRWPDGVSTTASMSIGTALSILQREFPAVTLSKIRFLESQGIVEPTRAPSGYRSYSQADIERLRFALAAQRDSFLPWAKIRERLEALDQGLSQEGSAAMLPTPGARVVTEDGELSASITRGRMEADELAGHAHVGREVIEAALESGLIQPDAGGKYTAETIPVVRATAQLLHHGLDVRHLRSLRNRAQRDVDLIEQVTSTARAHQSSAVRGSATETSLTLARALSDLHRASLEQGISQL